MPQRPFPKAEAAGGSFVAGGELRPGDGVVFDEGHPEQDEQGGRVATVLPRGPGRVEITFERGAVNPAAVASGAAVWKTDDPAVRRRLEQSFARDRVARRIPITARVWAQVGQKLQVLVRDDTGYEARIEWDQPLATAQKHPLTEALFREDNLIARVPYPNNSGFFILG